MYNKIFLFLFIGIFIISTNLNSQSTLDKLNKKLNVLFKGDSQIEVGSPFTGIEMHHGSFLLQRISFYYPAANSIDMSTDYFKRDTTYIMSVGLKIGSGKKQWLGLKPVQFELNPYSVKFHDADKSRDIEVKYEFCKDKPAMIVTYEITNRSNKADTFELYTRQELALKTCHTYATIDKALTSYDTTTGTIYADFDNAATQNAEVFVGNAGVSPESFSSSGSLNYSSHPSNDYWLNQEGSLDKKVFSNGIAGTPAANFLYKEKLLPNQKISVVQIIGSCKKDEGRDIINYLIKNYKTGVQEYREYVLSFIDKTKFKTNDKSIDNSFLWAKAILAVDKHYIDGRIRPMPCPAEYNFYFTHDVLLTDLAAAGFDLPRVKEDLLYTIGHADSNYIIPHAYYWKDSVYRTEYAESDNWNHFWFIIASASYLRHSGDLETLEKLYPYLTKSFQFSLENKKNNLMWEYRPDWWDIGHNYGPRAYTTILEIKTIRDYIYISYMLGKNILQLAGFESTAAVLNQNLVDKLWDKNLNYLINYYDDGSEDSHYYIGSLLAAHFGLLDKFYLDKLNSTAGNKLLNSKTGIYDASPMDFEKLKDKWKFADDEQGAPYLYINGGIWPHGNSWYSLSLIADDKKDKAYNFIKNVMTVQGTMKGPNGQPAMYEVRNGNYHDPLSYGKVDKPEFMWAGAWYIYSLYHLFGIKENDWNIELNPYLNKQNPYMEFTLTDEGKMLNINISGKGKYVHSIQYGGLAVPSLVLPHNSGQLKDIKIILGEPALPYVSDINSILDSCSYNEKLKTLSVSLKAFPGHRSEVEIISPFKPQSILKENQIIKDWNAVEENNVYLIKINIVHNNEVENLNIQF